MDGRMDGQTFRVQKPVVMAIYYYSAPLRIRRWVRMNGCNYTHNGWLGGCSANAIASERGFGRMPLPLPAELRDGDP